MQQIFIVLTSRKYATDFCHFLYIETKHLYRFNVT